MTVILRLSSDPLPCPMQVRSIHPSNLTDVYTVRVKGSDEEFLIHEAALTDRDPNWQRFLKD